MNKKLKPPENGRLFLSKISNKLIRRVHTNCRVAYLSRRTMEIILAIRILERRSVRVTRVYAAGVGADGNANVTNIRCDPAPDTIVVDQTAVVAANVVIARICRRVLAYPKQTRS